LFFKSLRIFRKAISLAHQLTLAVRSRDILADFASIQGLLEVEFLVTFREALGRVNAI
jgi:hypothetical protein